MVTNLTNLTTPPSGTQGFYHLAWYANSVTDGLFWGLILIAILMIIIVKNRNYGIDRAVAGASFACLIISFFLLWLEFVQIVYPIIFVVILAGTLAYIKFSGE